MYFFPFFVMVNEGYYKVFKITKVVARESKRGQHKSVYQMTCEKFTFGRINN